MLQFREIENLYLLAAIPLMILLFYLLIKWKQKAEKQIGDPSLVKQLVQGFSSVLFTTKFTLIVIAFALCAFAAADLVKPEGRQQVKRKGIDVMIALDVSKSMLAEDIKPNRLERAKQVVSRLIDKLTDDRIGIVVFAGRAYLQMPLTSDHSAAKMYLGSASTDDVPTQGTVISQALKMSYAAFNTKDKKYRSIILISDGEDHDEDAIKITKELTQQGIMVNTIGIGSPQGAPIMDNETQEYKKDEEENVVVSKLNEEELRSIAQTGQGLYQHFTSADEVADNLSKKLAGIGQSTLTDTTFASYKNYFWYFLLAAFILLSIENFIPEIRRGLKTSAAFILILCFSNLSFGQNVRKEIMKGNDAYKRKEFNEAANRYQRVIRQSPNATAYYNYGNALYKSDKLDEALKAYDNTVKAAQTTATKQKAYYNGGVVLQKQNKLPECIKAYKNALKLNPNDEDARQNLERALMQQKQQQDQNKNKDQNKDQNKDKNKNDQKDDPKPNPSKISKQDAEEKLKSLLEHEKDLQDKLHKVRTSSPEKPKKDW